MAPVDADQTSLWAWQLQQHTHANLGLNCAAQAVHQEALLPLSHPCCCAEGRLQLASVDAEAGVSGDEVLALAAAAERNTRHPLADALVAAAESRGE